MKKTVVVTIRKGSLNKLSDKLKKRVIVKTFTDSLMGLGDSIIGDIIKRKRNVKKMVMMVEID